MQISLDKSRLHITIATHLATDTIAGKYRIIREIARSNDVVYEAVDTELGRRIALKELVIPPNLTGQPRRERIERFHREARASGKLSHPNIVTVYGYGDDNGRYYIAMEYLEGGTLRDLLQSRGALPVREAVDIASQVLSGLAHAHSRQVIHRDVKPDNIHILPGGQVKLTDFGIARLTEEASLTGEGQVFGTPSYMSPEQIKGQHIDFRTDLFSVGIVLYEMVAGRKPFSGDSVISITYAIMEAHPPPLNGISYGLDQVIFRALNKDPIRRFSSADDMYRELKNADLTPGPSPLAGGVTGMGGFGFPAPAPAGGPAFPPYGSAGAPGRGGIFGPGGSTYNGSAGGPPPSAHSGHTGTVFAPPPVPAPAQPAGGPFVNWGASNPNNPAPGVPPPPFPRPAAGPVLSEASRTFMRAVVIAVIIGACVLAGVLLFMRAFEQTRSTGAQAAILQTIDRGLSSFASGDANTAIETLKQAWNASNRAADRATAGKALAKVYNELAVRAHADGNGRMAESLWHEALKYDERNEVVLDNLTDYYKLKGDSEAADRMRAARDGRMSGPNPAGPGDASRFEARQQDASQLFAAGQAAYEAGRIEEARQLLTKAIEKGTGTEIGAQATQMLGQLNNRAAAEWDPASP